MRKGRIAYVVNHVAVFVSHRLPLAVRARQSAFEVALFTGQAGSRLMEELAEDELVEEGVPHQRVAFRSGSINPFTSLFTRWWRLLRDICYGIPKI